MTLAYPLSGEGTTPFTHTMYEVLSFGGELNLCCPV